MSQNQIFKSTESRHRARALSAILAPSTPPTTIQSGVPVLFAEGGAVSFTASGNSTIVRTTNLPLNVTSLTYTNAGIGLAAGEATFAFDGTWNFAVTGALTTTTDGVPVYIVLADGTLTLTASTNTLFGYTDYPRGYIKVAGHAPVRIGK